MESQVSPTIIPHREEPGEKGKKAVQVILFNSCDSIQI
jgi:hypothetical protein